MPAQYIIKENKIYKCIKYNEQTINIIDINDPLIKNNIIKISYNELWDLEDFRTVQEAQTRQKTQQGTYYNSKYHERRRINEAYPQFKTLSDLNKMDRKERRIKWVLSV